MQKIQLELDDRTFEQVMQLAKLRGCTFEELFKDFVKKSNVKVSGQDHLLGMFADEPELMDEVLDSIMASREKHGLRSNI